MSDTLRLLISSGALAPGTKLHHAFHSHALGKVEAVVVKGGIEFRGKLYTTPSAAARTVTGKAVQGWAFWKLPNGQALGALRSG
jgi:hypothetical protein